MDEVVFHQLITGGSILLLVGLLIWGKIRAVYSFILVTALLYAFGVIDQSIILGNVINSSVVTLILLMLAALVLERTAILPWLATKISDESYYRTLLKLGVSSSLSSAFLNNTAVVATLMGTLLNNPFHSAQKLLIPLSYFSILGGTLTLVGTATNLVVSGLLQEQGLPALAIFDFLPIGAALLVGCGLIVFCISRWLPCSGKIKTYCHQDYFTEAEVRQDSTLIGNTVLKNGLRSLNALFLVEIVREKKLISPVTPDEEIQAGDKLIFAGDVSEVSQLSTMNGLELFSENGFDLDKNLLEVLVSPESILIGKTFKQVEFRSRFDAAVVAISRQGKTVSGKLGELTILAGDKLLLATGNDFDKRPNLSRNFFFLNQRKVKKNFSFKQNTVGILGFIVAVIIASVTPFSLIETLGIYILASLAMGILDGTRVRRRFPFELLAILVGALSIASAFSSSGLATELVSSSSKLLESMTVYQALLMILLLTVVMTEIMTNTAAAAIMLPLAISMSNHFNVSYMPFVMAVAYGASASFISPFGYQTNLMVMNAGGYKLSDFVKTGWLMTLTYIVITYTLIPIIFPF
ncbi:potassium transporter TrkA [Vibrio splendidus]|uniref:SLC13 family permease n=1 Tax=Vibrio splendidus TaxID=29497 RepID=UPI000C86534D|nr:SLC13 family permease [Vibrio splendidus]MBU2910350.1 SLC13 family permease [Vibrio splendidus]MDO6531102.1 SLC13 family permease [Vibrio splendidus]MDO6552036.1 SLC13 family permease [Vibrio splendidus]PMG09900.1 potassium transporter TrkA [Vibrio splendidus]